METSAMATIYQYMIGVYAILVKAGKWALSADDNPNNLPVVPEEYQIYVAQKLAEEAANGSTQS